MALFDRGSSAMMARPMMAALGGLCLAGGFSAVARAQGAPQTITQTRIDRSTLATGYRVSKVVGSVVVNQDGDVVGTIDDLIVTPNERVPFAVLSVGGFLGVGTKYVVVPFSDIGVVNKQMMLRGATRQSLLELPEFKYGT